MRGCGGEDGKVLLRVIRTMGGRSLPGQAQARFYEATGRSASRGRGFDVALGRLVDSGALKVCPDGCYEIPKVKLVAPAIEHRGQTFYSNPEFGVEEVTRESPWRDLMTGKARCRHLEDWKME
jgi:hypothetical protein